MPHFQYINCHINFNPFIFLQPLFSQNIFYPFWFGIKVHILRYQRLEIRVCKGGGVFLTFQLILLTKGVPKLIGT